MAFDINMIKDVYQRFGGRIEAILRNLTKEETTMLILLQTA